SFDYDRVASPSLLNNAILPKPFGVTAAAQPAALPLTVAAGRWYAPRRIRFSQAVDQGAPYGAGRATVTFHRHDRRGGWAGRLSALALGAGLAGCAGPVFWDDVTSRD